MMFSTYDESIEVFTAFLSNLARAGANRDWWICWGRGRGVTGQLGMEPNGWELGCQRMMLKGPRLKSKESGCLLGSQALLHKLLLPFGGVVDTAGYRCFGLEWVLYFQFLKNLGVFMLHQTIHTELQNARCSLWSSSPFREQSCRFGLPYENGVLSPLWADLCWYCSFWTHD